MNWEGKGLKMNAKNGRRQYQYVDGTAVRKLQPEYDYEPERRRKQEPKRTPYRRKKQKTPNMDFGMAIGLTAAAAFTAFLCVHYLRVQADITTMSKQVATMESTIMTMKEDNDTALENITSSIDLEHIYKVATEDLGMVHAGKEQVIRYDSTKSDSVKQYGDIPKSASKSIIDRILGNE